jgi:hypothetical protein
MVEVDKLIGYKYAPKEMTIDAKACILYALAIGFSVDPLNEDHFKYTYELAEEFRPFPTWAVIPAHDSFLSFSEESKSHFKVPGMPEYNLMMGLHGEETLFFHKPMQVGKTYSMQETVVDMQDKGSAGLLILDIEIREADSQDLCVTIRMGLFLRGLGGFGYKGTIKSYSPKIP